MNDHEDSGKTAHTTPEEGHPAGEGERSDREVGGPTPSESGDGEATGSGTSTRDSGFDSHDE